MLRDTRQSRGEREGLHPAEDVLERVQELEQEAAVEIHGARDVAEQHQPHLAPPALSSPQLDDLALHEVGPHAAPHVDDPAPPGRPLAPADAPGQPLGDQDREPGYLVEILNREGRKVLIHEDFSVADTGDLERLAVVVALLLPAFQGDRDLLLSRLRPGIAGVFLRDGRLGRAHEAVQPLALLGLEAPEDIEATVEGGKLLSPGDQGRAQRQVDVLAIQQVHDLQRPHPVHQLGDGEREARRPQHLAEAKDGGGEVARSGHTSPRRPRSA